MFCVRQALYTILIYLSSLIEWTLCAVVYRVSYGLTRSHTVSRGIVRSNTVSHGLVRSRIRLYTDMGHVLASLFFRFKNHTRLSRIHSNVPSVSRIRPRLVRLYVRFTQMANRISRVFCVRQALHEVHSNLMESNLNESRWDRM